MLSCQLKSCIIMIKLWCRFKWFLSMAIQARGRKCSYMVICMTAKTFGTQTQVCTFLWLKLLIGDVFCGMTHLAILFCMRHTKIVSGKFVVEFCCIETDQLKILSIMLTMTCKTLFTSHISRWMITFFHTDSGLDLCMAYKTFCIRNFITKHMALSTIGKPLKVRMHIRQIARRQLST